MKLRPSLDELKNLNLDEYTVAPVSTELLSDFTTPIETLRVLKAASQHVYMLESAQAQETWGRYTFLGFDPKMEISCINGDMKVVTDTNEEISFHTENPSEYLREKLAEFRSPRFDFLPSFTGGLVGYFSYDYLKYTEPVLKREVFDEDEFKDVDVMLFDKVIAFDNVRQKIILIANVRLDEIDTDYNRVSQELTELKNLIENGKKADNLKDSILGDFSPLFDKESYCKMVEKAKEHIYEGDIFQIVLSNRLAAPFEGSLLDTYRILRTINPSPYMFYFSGTDVEVAGASPETLVKLEDGVLHTFPLAGTRPRGKSYEEDIQLEKELLMDEKELAEHNMLVDLGRNDLGKISRFGTVEVESYMEILNCSR